MVDSRSPENLSRYLNDHKISIVSVADIEYSSSEDILYVPSLEYLSSSAQALFSLGAIVKNK